MNRNLSPEAQALLKAYRKRQKAKPDGHWLYGNQASKAYDALVALWTEDAALEILLSAVLDGQEAFDFYFYGGHGGSVAKEDNPQLVRLNVRLRQHYEQLPRLLKHHLDWLAKVHGY